MPHKKIKSLKITGNGGIIALIENRGNTYLAIQNRDCINDANLEISFKGKVKSLTPNGSTSQAIILTPGNLAIFAL